MAKKESAKPIDVAEANAKFFKNTEHHIADKLYNWVIERYTRNNHLFKFSDRFIWSGAFYVIPENVGYIIFFALFYFLGNGILKRYGWERMLMFFLLLIIWRINTVTKLLRKMQR